MKWFSCWDEWWLKLLTRPKSKERKLLTNKYGGRWDGVVVGKFQILFFQFKVIKGTAYSRFPPVSLCWNGHITSCSQLINFVFKIQELCGHRSKVYSLCGHWRWENNSGIGTAMGYLINFNLKKITLEMFEFLYPSTEQ